MNSNTKLATREPQIDLPTGLYEVKTKRVHEFNAHGPTTVGRSRHCDIKILHGTVSMRHCEITSRDGTVWIEDSGSTNGTLVNNVPVQCVPLKPGMRVVLGNAELYVMGSNSDIWFLVRSKTSLFIKAAYVFGSARRAGRHVHTSHMSIIRARRKRETRFAEAEK